MKGDKPEHRYQTDPQEWLERARRDVEYAKVGKGRKAFVQSVLLCQRALEKSFTAYLVARGLVFTMTHDVGKLFRLAADDAFALTRFGEEVAWLAAFKPEVPGTATTAPQKLPPAGEAELDRALKLGTEIVAWVEGQVGGKA